jgi:hypothetical protein
MKKIFLRISLLAFFGYTWGQANPNIDSTEIIGTWISDSHSFDSVIDSLEQEILGMWVLENDSSTKIKFESNGDIKYYSGNALVDTATYEITVTCDGEQQGLGSGIYFLKRYPNQGGSTCAYIENINYNGNNRMVLMTQDQGKIIVYVRP